VADGGRVDSAHIDRFLTLMQQRLAVMHDVAKWKWNEKKSISDPQREQELLDRLVNSAKERDVDVEFARPFFTAHMTASKAIQQADFDHWQAENQGEFADAPDLVTELRPRITQISDDLLDALSAVESQRDDTAFRRQVASRAAQIVVGESVTESIRATAIGPLIKTD
jgi:chorismate mutase